MKLSTLKQRLSGWPTARAMLGLFLCVGLTASSAAQERWGGATSGAGRDRTASLGGMASRWGTDQWLGGRPSATQQWVLGIREANTNTGVMVREVEHGSAAQRARIEAGDILVSVGGYQVGLVGRDTFDISEEINRRADESGLVTILLQDHTNGRLANVQVQLSPKNKTLGGTLVYRGRNRLPSDAIVTIEVENLSQPHYEVHLLNNTFRAQDVVNGSFEIPYDPAFINNSDTYEIHATVTSQGKTVLASDRSNRVFSRGNPTDVRIELMSLSQLIAGNNSTTAVSAGYQNYGDADTKIRQYYQTYLGRAPDTIELVAWRASSALSEMPIELMASQEYFDLVGNHSEVWIRQVFETIVGKRPTNDELQQWVRHLANLRNSRMDLLRHLRDAVKG